MCDYFLDFVGGAQTSMRQQQLALEAAGHEVTMVSAARGRGARVRPVADGITITPAFTLPGLELPVIPNIARTRNALRRLFVAERVDVVHVQTEFGLAHAAADVAGELGIPVIHTVHTLYWASDAGWHAPLEPIVRRLLVSLTGAEIPRRPLTSRPVDNLLRNVTLAMAARADAVISPSAHQGRDLKAAGIEVPITVVPNPIGVTARPKVPLPATGLPRFLWVARCDTVKRPLPFAEAAIDALARTGNGFSVDFVGDGAERPALQKLVAGYPELRVQGALPHDRVLDLMDSASAVVLSSLGFDNQPMTIAEAVSRERGILYCDPKLREGLLHAGYLAENPSPTGLADALVALVQNPELLRELSRGAAQDGAQFSPGSYVKNFARLARALATP
ncbi:MAG TPA: glycosyltransferase family 4 protein [Marisediminicola sp.]|nr:glycosyltransferase family 4 protein [Marisediminicola sp.]